MKLILVIVVLYLCTGWPASNWSASLSSPFPSPPPRVFFLCNMIYSLIFWLSSSPWGYASGKVHRESHRVILSYSYTNHHFQFWEKMEIIFFSHIPDMGCFVCLGFFFCLFVFFFPLKKNLHKSNPVNLLIINLHSRTSEMFLFSHLYLPFSIFNIFIMIFSCWSSIRKGHITGFKLSCCYEYHDQWRYIFWMTLKSKINNEKGCKMHY